MTVTASLRYLVESVPWALGGLLVGFFLGRGAVVINAVADAVQPERLSMSTDHTDDDQGDAGTARPRRRRRLSTNTVIVGVIVVLGLLGAAQAYVQGEESDRNAAETEHLVEANQQLSKCLEDFANGVADALDERFTASSAAQQALDDLLDAVSSATPTPEGRALAAQALADYRQKRTDAKAAQKANPYPAAPRDVCPKGR